MKNVPYVRTEMLDEQEAPGGNQGIVSWLHVNMFSSIGSGVLTILSLFLIYQLLSGILPWIFQSSWTANSLGECREAIAHQYGEGTEGACWSVVAERYNQLLFGFYPNELYWRPILAFVLLGAAIAPVLFDKIPRKVLIFTAIYPFLVFWLIWGGSIWLPLSVMAGFAIGYFASVVLTPVTGSLVASIASMILPVFWWIFAAGDFADLVHGIIPIGLQSIASDQLGGFTLSILIGLVGITFSLPIGILLALGRQSDLFVVKIICVGFIEFIRGVPLITLLFVASTLLNYFMPPGTSFDLVLRVMIMVTLFASAYMAEVIRGGLAAIPTGQYEAAAALGLDFWKATRLIIMPQALKISIPNIVSNFIGLFKDTTLVSIIGLLDPMGLSNAIRANQEWNGIVWELYVFIALMFWIICFSMSRYSMYLERKLQTGH